MHKHDDATPCCRWTSIMTMTITILDGDDGDDGTERRLQRKVMMSGDNDHGEVTG